MRISRRTSGGRGEYEISGATESGITAATLSNHRLSISLGSVTFDSGSVLTNQGGKRRLRRTIFGAMQVARQLATALLLPVPVRADLALGAGLPVIQAQRRRERDTTGRFASRTIYNRTDPSKCHG
jgi:hypothetical protein